MDLQQGLPKDIQTNRPNAARMYDYFLGGHHNFEIDRHAADQAIALWPDFPLVMQVIRAFLRRAVRFLVAEGIDQFLDVGSGIPTVGNVHEVAQQANPAARVVYVDVDPIAVAQSRALLRDNRRATVIPGDVRQPERILSHPEVARLLDLRQPVGLLVVAVLHFIGDEADPNRAMRVFREALAPGSFLAIQHASDEGLSQETLSPEAYNQLVEIYRRTPTPIILRPRVEVARMFGDFELVPPGLVGTPLWRPEGPEDLFLNEPARAPGYAGLGRKR
jgi:SAM-dependent methyltransferase